MTELDDKLVPVADNLINVRFGRSVTYIEVTARVYDPDTMQTTGGTTEHSIKCTPFSPFDVSRESIWTNLKIDIVTYLAALGLPFLPKEGDRIRDADGTEYEIQAFRPVQSGDAVAVYRLGLSK